MIAGVPIEITTNFDYTVLLIFNDDRFSTENFRHIIRRTVSSGNPVQLCEHIKTLLKCILLNHKKHFEESSK